jgi:hypothetical protein
MCENGGQNGSAHRKVRIPFAGAKDTLFELALFRDVKRIVEKFCDKTMNSFSYRDQEHPHRLTPMESLVESVGIALSKRILAVSDCRTLLSPYSACNSWQEPYPAAILQVI